MSRSSITVMLLSCALLVLAFACQLSLAQETATEEVIHLIIAARMTFYANIFIFL
jgi:hypothetical protein